MLWSGTIVPVFPSCLQAFCGVDGAIVEYLCVDYPGVPRIGCNQAVAWCLLIPTSVVTGVSWRVVGINLFSLCFPECLVASFYQFDCLEFLLIPCLVFSCFYYSWLFAVRVSVIRGAYFGYLRSRFFCGTLRIDSFLVILLFHRSRRLVDHCCLGE